MQITSNSHQIKDLVEKGQKILLLTHTEATPEEIGCLLAFYLGLENLGKEVVAVFPSSDGLPENTKFLPSAERVVFDVGPKNLVISIDYGSDQIEKVSYNTEGGKLNLVVTPRDKSFDIENIQYGFSGIEVDLVFVFGARDLSLLGSLYETFKEELEKTPLVNFDYQEDNSQFGSINVVDFTKSSLAEVVYPLFTELGLKTDEKIATCLLASLFWATSSFRRPGLGPKTFLLASDLLKEKADIKRVTTGLYQNRTLSDLYLWSRITSGVQFHKDLGLLVFEASKKDLSEEEIKKELGEDLIKSLLFLLEGATGLTFFQQLTENKTKVSLFSIEKEKEFKEFVKSQQGVIRKEGGYFLKEGALSEIRSEVIRDLKEFLSQPFDIQKTKEEIDQQVQEVASQIGKEESASLIEPPKIYTGSS